MTYRTIFASIALTSAIASAGGTAFAQHDHGQADMLVGSDIPGGGRLLIEYPFDERPVVRVTKNSGFPGLFDATSPGFVPADEPGEIEQLANPTTVELEVTGIDANVRLQVGGTSLANAGESAVIGTHDCDIGTPGPCEEGGDGSGLHRHPLFQLFLSTLDDEFAEGRVSFRLKDQDAAYADSEIVTFRLSNGFLPALDDPEKTDLACRTAVSKEIEKLHRSIYREMAKCLERIAAAEHLGGSETAALKACRIGEDSKSLSGRLSAARRRAFEKIEKTCGSLAAGSAPFTDSAVHTHLGMASCRAQELVGATYNGSRDEIVELLSGRCNGGFCNDGQNSGVACNTDDDCSVEEIVAEAFPCLVMSQVE
jgi:hypothetical protein